MESLEQVPISRIAKKYTRDGNPYYLVQAGHETVSFFEEVCGELEKVETGDLATIDFSQNGQFKNGIQIRDVVKKSGGSSSKESTELAQQDDNYWEQKDQSIERQSAVRTAAILLQGREISDEDLKAVTETAYQFIKTGTFNEHQED